MAVTIRWLGHSAYALNIAGHKLLVDPFVSGNPLAKASAKDLDAEVILLTHAHGDHVGDSVEIAKRTGALVVCNFEMGDWFTQHGVQNVYQGNPGGTFRNDWMSAKWTIAFHSSSFPDGTYGGQPNGFVIRGGGSTIYHAGDTCLFSDMRLIGDEGLDVALLPIGDCFTMGIDDSIKAIRLLRPDKVSPMHYNTFPPIVQDVGAWAERVAAETEAEAVVLEPDGEMTL
ncbi:MAG: metal-dependent hydrolase [Chloroflexota bacterium]|nr:metal-dependent hydrolase [Chloroflexota bacterium]MCY3582935.1 metal-dependent hydrolase [Chloroflexota bacterium]MDE2649698.1 metal-dependent hydrolase [Chloroflexota bacterium]MXX50979.1 metal-dependent hydrolase [Chloroflexota bacterium]MXX83219.1 metal-dependent hydrolase [Chloroflexota bacterium]